MAQTTFRNRFQVVNQEAPVQKLNFSHSLRPIYLVSRAFGFMPFSIVYYPNGNIHKPRVSILDGLWFVISLCIYTFGIYFVFLYAIFNQLDAKMSWVLVISCTICFEIGFIFGYLSIIFDMGNRFKLIDIMKKFIIFDQEASPSTLVSQFILNILICIEIS